MPETEEPTPETDLRSARAAMLGKGGVAQRLARSTDEQRQPLSAQLTETAAAIRRDHKRWIVFGLLMVLVYLPVWIELVGDWNTDDNYSHGFLIIPVSLFFLWRDRREWQTLTPRPTVWGWLAIIGGFVLFILGTAGAEYFTARLSMVVILFGCLWTFGGAPVLRLTWFPVAFLLFMIPIPYVIYYAAAFPLQLLASDVSSIGLKAIGMKFVQEGNIIRLPNYSLEVAEACSGLRSLVSLLALGAAYARLTQPRLWQQILLFALTVPIALAANVVRVWGTAVGAYAISPKIAEDFLHGISGMVVFMVSFILLVIFGVLLSRIGRKRPAVGG